MQRSLILSLLLLAGHARGQFTITSISDNTGPIDSYQNLMPALSNTGAVAFTATLDPPVATPPYAVFRYEGGVTTQIAATDSSAYFDLGEPSLSSDGSTLSFGGAFDDQLLTNSYYSQGVARYVTGGGAWSVLDASTHSTTPGVINIDEFPYVSEIASAAANGGLTGYVVRIASVDPTPFNSKRRRIYSHDGTTRTLLVEDGTTRPASGGPNTPVNRTPGFKLATADFIFAGMNNSGRAAFRSKHPDIAAGVAGSIGIYTAGPGGIQTIMEEGIAYEPNKTFNTFKPFAITDSGSVLLTSNFLSNPPGGPLTSGSGFYLKAPGNTAPVLVAPGSFFITKAAISANGGKIAFRAQIFSPVSTTGIFTGPDPVANRVIANGDPLFGSTVADVNIQRNAVNDAGQIVFYYRLSNGVRGIALATPPLPELLHSSNGNTLQLSWATNASVTLLTSTDLVQWNAVPGPFGTAGGMTTWSTPMGVRSFFRLAKP